MLGSDIIAQKYTQIKAYKLFKQHNLEPLEPYINCKTKMKCLNNNGYIIDISLGDVNQNKSGKLFSKNNRFVLDNIKKYIHDDTNGDYEYICGEFKNAYSVFGIIHKKCGRVFHSKWYNIYRKASEKEPNRHGTRCPFCAASQLESTHALVLKQVWMHEKNGTIVEDMSCINPKTNHPLPTDIVNHNEKIAIEVQSWFHDFKKQKDKDKIKKEFWIKKGYNFYAIDQREYTVLEMIKMFFPYIEEIPSYVDFDYSNKINDVRIQQKLNSGISIREIAKAENCKPHTIYDAIRYGRIRYPLNYKNKSFSPVVQLDTDYNYISEYESIKKAIDATGIKNISSVLCSKKHYSGGYIWFYKEDYYNNIIQNAI